MARPRKEVSESMVYKLARINCSVEEMGVILDVSADTLQRRFAAVIEKGRAQMKQSLKRKQYQVAMNGSGNVTMLIWLGKQHLGQSDKVENSNENRNLGFGDLPVPDAELRAADKPN